MSAIARHEHEWEKTNRDFNYRATRLQCKTCGGNIWVTDDMIAFVPNLKSIEVIPEGKAVVRKPRRVEEGEGTE